MNVAIVGLGGVGGYLAGMISRISTGNSEVNLSCIARGQHLEVAKSQGLLVKTSTEQILSKPDLVTDNFDELPELDLCFITVKSYELDNVIKKIAPKIKNSTVIVPLLNGADIYERIRRNLSNAVVLRSCIYIISYIEKPGTIVQKGAAAMIHTGSETGKDDAASAGAADVLDLFELCGIKYRWYDDPRPVIWKKFLFIASFALVSANYNAVYGAIMESEKLSSDVKAVMNEIKNIADAKGIILNDDVCEKAYAIGNKLDYNGTTSFQRDYRTPGKPDERDIFGEAVISMGAECGVTTEVTERLYNQIQKNKPLNT